MINIRQRKSYILILTYIFTVFIMSNQMLIAENKDTLEINLFNKTSSEKVYLVYNLGNEKFNNLSLLEGGEDRDIYASADYLERYIKVNNISEDYMIISKPNEKNHYSLLNGDYFFIDQDRLSLSFFVFSEYAGSDVNIYPKYIEKDEIYIKKDKKKSIDLYKLEKNNDNLEDILKTNKRELKISEIKELKKEKSNKFLIKTGISYEFYYLEILGMIMIIFGLISFKKNKYREENCENI